MSPSILATGNVWDHILVCFWVCPKSTFELLFKRKNIYIHFCSFTGLFVGNFSEMRGCWKALQLWRQLNSSWAGNLPGFSHGGQVLMHGGGRGGEWARKEACCVPSLSLQHPREGHSGTLPGLPCSLLNGFYFQEFLIHFYPGFLTMSEYISHIGCLCPAFLEGAC